MQKILLCILSSVLILTNLLGKDLQKIKNVQGFTVEIINDSSNSIKKSFISIEDIQRLSLDSTITKGKTTTVWLGASLCNVWKEILGISCEDVNKVSVSSPDGYMSVLFGELIPAINTAICAYRIKGDKDLPPEYGYMKLIFPELRKMYWVNEPDKMVIDLCKKANTVSEYQFYFLSNQKLQALINKDLNSTPYIILDDILLELQLPRNSFNILTTDKLLREYMPDKIIRNVVLQKEKNDTWRINGINVPVGLKTRRIFFLLSGNKGLFLKSLSEYEQNLWQNLFWLPIVQKIPPESEWKIEIILNDGKHIISNLTENFKSGQISLYTLFQMELNSHSEIDHFKLKW